MSESFLNDRMTLHPGDCLDVLDQFEECSIDSCVTDPPYHLTSIVKRFGGENAAPAQFGEDGAYARASAGFMGKQWDGGDIAFRPELWAKVYRVLKPGAHLLAFGGTRTYHRMACAIEDAGFEIRDTIMWVYGSGFPKSHDISKAIDRAAGAEREQVRTINPRNPKATGGGRDGMKGATRPWIEEAIKRGYHEKDGDEPATDLARQWSGFGTALKPACEPIVLARKPLSEPTIAANVLKWGTGALNIEACRVESTDSQLAEKYASVRNAPPRNNNIYGSDKRARSDGQLEPHVNGRWPANIIHDGSKEVVEVFPHTSSRQDISIKNASAAEHEGNRGPAYGRESRAAGSVMTSYGDEGSAARFFYTAKADSDDRLGSKHPTVKPLDLMQYLVRLITPPKGRCLDPFAGTGTTGEAAWREGMSAVLIEREAEYQDDIRRRMKLALGGHDERARESIKARMKDKPIDHGPLFGVPAP